jgi:excisionase family DNA binding protein
MARAAQLERQDKPDGAGAVTLARDPQALLTIEDVAGLLKLPVSWVYERTRRRGFDRIPGFRLGKYWRFRESEVLEWLERQRAGAKPNA